jgi:hypothetical protein
MSLNLYPKPLHENMTIPEQITELESDCVYAIQHAKVHIGLHEDSADGYELASSWLDRAQQCLNRLRVLRHAPTKPVLVYDGAVGRDVPEIPAEIMPEAPGGMVIEP